MVGRVHSGVVGVSLVLSSSYALSASYANNGIPTGGTTNYVLAKNSPSDYDTVWIPSPSGPAGSGEFTFTSSYFSGSTSSTTGSSLPSTPSVTTTTKAQSSILGSS